MTEALAEVAEWALRQPGIWRIGDLCDVENVASARVMEKAGLSREGAAAVGGASQRRRRAARLLQLR